MYVCGHVGRCLGVRAHKTKRNCSQLSEPFHIPHAVAGGPGRGLEGIFCTDTPNHPVGSLPVVL